MGSDAFEGPASAQPTSVTETNVSATKQFVGAPSSLRVPNVAMGVNARESPKLVSPAAMFEVSFVKRNARP